MKKLVRFLLLTVLTPCLMAPAYAQLMATANVPQPSGMTLSLELLSDTNGANIDPYVKNLIADRSNGQKLLIMPFTRSQYALLCSQRIGS